MLSAADNELLTKTGAGTPMGQLLRRFWVPALPRGRGRGAAVPAGTRDADGGAARGVAGRGRTAGRAGGAMRAPPCVAVLRPQREPGVAGRQLRPALRVPRLEVRHRRPLRRHAERAVTEQVQGPHPPHRLPGGRARRHRVDLPRPRRGHPAVARPGVGGGPAEPPLRLQAAPVQQLRPGDGGRHRLKPRVLPALGRQAVESRLDPRQGQHPQLTCPPTARRSSSSSRPSTGC